jgi:hypothetical protein
MDYMDIDDEDSAMQLLDALGGLGGLKSIPPTPDVVERTDPFSLQPNPEGVMPAIEISRAGEGPSNRGSSDVSSILLGTSTSMGLTVEDSWQVKGISKVVDDTSTAAQSRIPSPAKSALSVDRDQSPSQSRIPSPPKSVMSGVLDDRDKTSAEQSPISHMASPPKRDSTFSPFGMISGSLGISNLPAPISPFIIPKSRHSSPFKEPSTPRDLSPDTQQQPANPPPLRRSERLKRKDLHKSIAPQPAKASKPILRSLEGSYKTVVHYPTDPDFDPTPSTVQIKKQAQTRLIHSKEAYQPDNTVLNKLNDPEFRSAYTKQAIQDMRLGTNVLFQYKDNHELYDELCEKITGPIGSSRTDDLIVQYDPRDLNRAIITNNKNEPLIDLDISEEGQRDDPVNAGIAALLSKNANKPDLALAAYNWENPELMASHIQDPQDEQMQTALRNQKALNRAGEFQAHLRRSGTPFPYTTDKPSGSGIPKTLSDDDDAPPKAPAAKKRKVQKSREEIREGLLETIAEGNTYSPPPTTKSVTTQKAQNKR